MEELQKAIDLLREFVRSNIEDGWCLSIDICNDDASVERINPDGECADDDGVLELSAESIRILCLDTRPSGGVN